MTEEHLKNIKQWFDHDYLTIHMNKTYFIPICTGSNQLPIYKLQLKDIHSISETKKLNILA